MMAALAFGQGEAAGMPAGRGKQREPAGSPSGAVEQAAGSGLRAPDAVTYIYCDTLLEVKSGSLLKAQLITLRGNKIESVKGATPAERPPAGANLISLSNATCLPGLIDTHTHVLLQ